MDYQQQALAVMNPVEMVVALYDGMVRFLHGAIASIEAGDVEGRRQSVGYTLDILTYLQARLRLDLGGQSAAALSEFYAAMYSQCVRASRDASVQLCEQTIANIKNVRDAWRTAAENENSTTEQARNLRMKQHLLESRQASAASSLLPDGMNTPVSNRWSA